MEFEQRRKKKARVSVEEEKRVKEASFCDYAREEDQRLNAEGIICGLFYIYF